MYRNNKAKFHTKLKPQSVGKFLKLKGILFQHKSPMKRVNDKGGNVKTDFIFTGRLRDLFPYTRLRDSHFIIVVGCVISFPYTRLRDSRENKTGWGVCVYECVLYTCQYVTRMCECQN